MLEYISPADLNPSWEIVRDGLFKVCKRASDGWIPEDVYYACRQGTSTLHLVWKDDEYVGFVVLTPMHGYDCKKLMIWIGYNAGEKDAVEVAMEDIEELARKSGARKVLFGSPRNWERRLPDYKPTTTYYEKEV
jgi:hypothetical protein